MNDDRLRDLLEKMTLEEKVGQMVQISGEFLEKGSVLTGPMLEKGFTNEAICLAGSVIGIQNAATMRRIQKNYMERHPHEIPALFMMDVINGYRTVFPIPLAQGCAFEPDLSEKCSSAAAREAASSGIHVTFAPMADLVRDARWGRVMESPGEDPYLNSLYCRAMVRGFQGEDIKYSGKIAACVKHFAAYGAPVAGRDYNTVELSENTLREFYIPAYDSGIKAGAEMVMAAFNTVNRIPSTGNKWLLKDLLRKELGFDGVLISDWAAIEELIAHGYCNGRKEAAEKAFGAGIDIDMMSGIYSEHLSDLVRSETINEKEIDKAVYRILRLKNRLGLFEHPYKDAGEEEEKKYFLCQKHRKLALEAAEKSCVLLKNEGEFPLKIGRKTAFIGPYVNTNKLTGSWSFTGDKKEIVSIKEILSEYPEYTENITCMQGSPMIEFDMELKGFDEEEKEKISGDEIEKMLDDAEEVAKEAQSVVMFLGEHFLQSGEAASRAYITIPSVQKRLFDRVYNVNKNISVVLFSGRPLDIMDISRKANAILLAWLPGTEGARAIMNILTGTAAPEGKLSMSFPWSVGQIPIFYNSDSTGRPYDNHIQQDRFRSRYLDIPNEPLYPFGYGLTYTSFSISEVVLDRTRISRGEKICASVLVKNTGRRTGIETIQMYIRDLVASVVRPVKELKAFKKITILPGEEKTVCFDIGEQELSFYKSDGRYGCEEGKFRVYIGTDSRTDNFKEFILE